jgi:hypothetical protein
MTVNDRVRAIATFRFIEVRLMEIVAGWTPTTAEMEAKVLFGRHIWDFAQHADALGKRTFELRQPEHYTLRATEDYVGLLENAAKATSTSERLSTMYDAVLPGLERRYRDYIAATDAILDEPSLIIIDRILVDLARMRRDAAALREEIGIGAADVASLVASEAAVGSIVTPIQAGA